MAKLTFTAKIWSKPVQEYIDRFGHGPSPETCKFRSDAEISAMADDALSANEAKNGVATSFPLNRDAQRILRRRKEIKLELERRYPYLIQGKPKGIEYVFVQEHRSVVSNGKPFATNSLTNKTWRKAVLNAGLPKGVVFHTLRHTFASWHIMEGTGERTLMELGGWKSSQSMKRYMHLNHTYKAKEASKIEGMLRRK